MISSVDNARVKAARALSRPRRRRETGLCLLEGVRLIETAVDAGAHVVTAFVSPAARDTERGRRLIERLGELDTDVFDVTERVLASISTTETPQGIVATARIPDTSAREFSTMSAILVADRISDPGNLGTLARTAAATGAGLWMTVGSTDLFDAKTLRASAGAAFLLPVRQRLTADNIIATCRRFGLRLFAADAGGRHRYDEVDWRSPFAIVIGNEAHGVDRAFLDAADAVVHLPMQPGVESLNAAVTGSVCLFEAVRQRTARTSPPSSSL